MLLNSSQKCAENVQEQQGDNLGITVKGFFFKLDKICFEDYRDPKYNQQQCAKFKQDDKWIGECRSGCSYYEDEDEGNQGSC